MRKPIVRAWTDEEIEKLKALLAAGASVTRCSAALNRASTGVRMQARKLGISVKGIRASKRISNAKIAAAESLLRGVWRNNGTRM
jgi:predicted lipid-binding transport protein (Tim44 family)